MYKIKRTVTKNIRYVVYNSLFSFFLLLFIGCAQKNNDGFESIFNGENLEGWSGDETYWSVKDGILIGEVTAETILKRNSFIIYEKEQPSNFELKLEYRISKYGNSGINYRSEFIENIPYALRGYQCDIDGKNKYTGQNYEEKKRTTLAYIGETVIIPQLPDSIPKSNLRKNVKRNCWQTRVVESKKALSELKSRVKDGDWNTVHIIVINNKLQHYVNDVLFSEVSDLDEINRTLKGYLGVQVHVGPPMKVEYKHIRLKSY